MQSIDEYQIYQQIADIVKDVLNQHNCNCTKAAYARSGGYFFQVDEEHIELAKCVLLDFGAKVVWNTGTTLRTRSF